MLETPAWGDGARKTAVSREIALSQPDSLIIANHCISPRTWEQERVLLLTLLEDKIPVCGSTFAHRSPGLCNGEQMPSKIDTLSPLEKYELLSKPGTPVG